MPTATLYHCDSCGRPFEATRPAATCGNACRLRRHREKVAADAVAHATALMDLSTRMHNLKVAVIVDGIEAHTEEIERLAADLQLAALAVA